MDVNVWVALITASSGLCGAAITYLLAKRQQRDADQRARKVTQYQELITAISDLAAENSNVDAHHRFARAVNTTVLVAPQPVVTALMNFFQGVKASNRPFNREEHDRLLGVLVLAFGPTFA